MNTLCIDFGSTFVKFFVYDGKDVLLSDKVNFPPPCIDDKTIYQIDIKKIDETVFKIFERVSAFSVKKCFIAVQMHGYILKTEFGAFSNYVSWKDKSGDIKNPILKSIDLDRNGTSLKSNLPIVKLIAKRQVVFEFFTLGSYIIYRLTGRNITHKTDGCASGFFDAENLKPTDLFAHAILPVVTDGISLAGEYDGIKIYTAVGDHQASFLGSGAGEDAYLLNIGTATQLSTLHKNANLTGAFEKRPYFTNSRLITVSGLTGGEKLFDGYPVINFCFEVLNAIKKIPHKPRMLVGGGGSEIVFEELKVFLKKHGIECIKLTQNISTEGMKMISNMNSTKIGTMLSEVCFSNFPVIMKNENLDFLIIDNEHGAFDYTFLSSIVMNSRLVGMPLIVRLPDNNRKDITKLVDMGVTGFLLPMTNTMDDIKQVVNFAKYAPIGKRGISTNRAHTFYNPPPIDEYIKTANQTVKVYAQIETKSGVDHIDDILSVDGVDGVFIGPNDLSCDLNCIGDNAPIKESIRIISDSAVKHKKSLGIITTSKDLIDFSLECNADFISYGSEINMLKDSCKKIRGVIYG